MLYDINKASLIQAHETEMAVLALSPDGSKIATASEKGTLVRVWDCGSGEPLRELRRGVDRAEIYCLSFNSSSTYLACSSDKGTVHVFALSDAGAVRSHCPVDVGAAVASDSGANTPASSTTTPSSSLASQQHPPVEADASNMRSGLAFVKSILPGLVPKYFASELSRVYFYPGTLTT